MSKHYWLVLNIKILSHPSLICKDKSKQTVSLFFKYLLKPSDQLHIATLAKPMVWVWGRGYVFFWPMAERGLFGKPDWKQSLCAFDLKQRSAEWSPYDIKVPRERFECIWTDCFLIALAVIQWSFCAALLQVEHTYYFCDSTLLKIKVPKVFVFFAWML